MMKKNKIIKLFYILCFITAFLPMLMITIIPKTSAHFVVASILCFILAIFIFFRCTKKIYKFSLKLWKLKVFRYYTFFIIWGIITTIVHLLLGTYTAPWFYYILRIKDYYAACILVYLIPITGVFLNININKIIKIFYIITFLVIIIGVIQYLSFILHWDFISDLIGLLSNGREYREDIDDCKNVLRAYSVFDEPDMFARFIFICMPLLFSFVYSKYKLFKNTIINSILSKSIILLAMSCIIFTKSPIYLLFGFGEYFILLIYYNFNKFKNIIPLLLLFVFIIAVLIGEFSNEIEYLIHNSYIERICRTVSSFDSLESLIKADQSLATRVISYMIYFNIFKNNMFFGVGIHNAEVYTNNLLSILHMPLTHEFIVRYYNTPYAITINQSAIFTTLAETGGIGLFLFLRYIIENILSLNKIKKFLDQQTNSFLVGLMQSTIAVLVISFYTTPIKVYIPWFILGLDLMFIFYIKNMRVIKKMHE